jgi:hypothetical protein
MAQTCVSEQLLETLRLRLRAGSSLRLKNGYARDDSNVVLLQDLLASISQTRRIISRWLSVSVRNSKP